MVGSREGAGPAAGGAASVPVVVRDACGCPSQQTAPMPHHPVHLIHQSVTAPPVHNHPVHNHPVHNHPVHNHPVSSHSSAHAPVPIPAPHSAGASAIHVPPYQHQHHQPQHHHFQQQQQQQPQSQSQSRHLSSAGDSSLLALGEASSSISRDQHVHSRHHIRPHPAEREEPRLFSQTAPPPTPSVFHQYHQVREPPRQADWPESAAAASAAASASTPREARAGNVISTTSTERATSARVSQSALDVPPLADTTKHVRADSRVPAPTHHHNHDNHHHHRRHGQRNLHGVNEEPSQYETAVTGSSSRKDAEERRKEKKEKKDKKDKKEKKDRASSSIVKEVRAERSLVDDSMQPSPLSQSPSVSAGSVEHGTYTAYEAERVGVEATVSSPSSPSPTASLFTATGEPLSASVVYPTASRSASRSASLSSAAALSSMTSSSTATSAPRVSAPVEAVPAEDGLTVSGRPRYTTHEFAVSSRTAARAAAFTAEISGSASNESNGGVARAPHDVVAAAAAKMYGGGMGRLEDPARVILQGAGREATRDTVREALPFSRMPDFIVLGPTPSAVQVAADGTLLYPRVTHHSPISSEGADAQSTGDARVSALCTATTSTSSSALRQSASSPTASDSSALPSAVPGRSVVFGGPSVSTSLAAEASSSASSLRSPVSLPEDVVFSSGDTLARERASRRIYLREEDVAPITSSSSSSSLPSPSSSSTSSARQTDTNAPYYDMARDVAQLKFSKDLQGDKPSNR